MKRLIAVLFVSLASIAQAAPPHVEVEINATVGLSQVPAACRSSYVTFAYTAYNADTGDYKTGTNNTYFDGGSGSSNGFTRKLPLWVGMHWQSGVGWAPDAWFGAIQVTQQTITGNDGLKYDVSPAVDVTWVWGGADNCSVHINPVVELSPNQ